MSELNRNGDTSLSRLPVLLLAAFLLSAGLSAYSAPDDPAPAHRCPGLTPDVVVATGRKHDAVLVCSGAGRAMRFFDHLDLPHVRNILFRLHPALARHDTAHIGYYDAHSQRIDFLTYAACAEQCATQPPFKLPMNEELYIGFAAHETSHAVIDEVTAGRPLSRVAHEYLAYVVQISTMAPAERDAMLQGYGLQAFENPQQISLTYYALNPCAFGVKAYRHYTTLPDPTGFIHDLLDGKVRLGASRGEWW